MLQMNVNTGAVFLIFNPDAIDNFNVYSNISLDVVCQTVRIDRIAGFNLRIRNTSATTS